MKPAYLLAAVALVAVVAVIMLMGSAPTTPPVAHSYHNLSNQSHQDLADLMEQGGRIGLAVPENLTWMFGDSGRFEVGVRNVMNETQPFYMNIYSESGSGMSFVYVQPGALDPDNYSITNVSALSVGKGTQVYRVVVCTQEPCETMKSEGLYATQTIEVDVE